MQRSRRLLFVLSPDFLAEKSFSLLECRLGLYLQHGRRATIVAVTFRSVSKAPSVEAVQIRRAAAATVAWRGTRSEPRRSRFWLRLRLALPLRPLALGRRLIDSTSSHSDLSAVALQRRSQAQRANQSRRHRQAPPRGRGRSNCGRACRRDGAPPVRRCSGCAGFTDQVDPGGAGLVAVTDRTETPSDPAPEAQPTTTLGSSPTPHLPSGPDSAHLVCQQSNNKHTQQHVIGPTLSDRA
ncbi:uncharacterized protein V6R79_009237 [Siganus canaliculatus]